MLIDDEADNASINGKYKLEKRENEPTKINGQIRNLLNLFNKACYVGYTATPFANVLIDPSVDSDEYGKDLFPSNFIYTLEESSDYFGAKRYSEITTSLLTSTCVSLTMRTMSFLQNIKVALSPLCFPLV